MWNPDRHLESLYQTNAPRFAFDASDAAPLTQWQDALRGKLAELLGGLDEEPAPTDPVVLEETSCDGYIRLRIEYTVEEGLRAPAYVLIPEARPAPLPAVVACHGHGYGSREIVGLPPDGHPQPDGPGYQKNFAVELARRGFLVIAPEILGFGETRLAEHSDAPPNKDSCHRISTYLMMLGRTTLGMRVKQVMRAIDYLQSRGDVNMNRVGCMGISGGGTLTVFTAALDPRINAAVVSGYANTFHDSILAMHHCLCNFVPHLLEYAEMPDIIGLLAPRPLLIESGADDPIYPIGAADRAYERVKLVYEVAGAADRLDRDTFDGGHEISGMKAYPWLVRHLQGL
ncbi:dienelactone hydrolase family protein [Cohnella sp. JJ-181]|uniref:dienelactone hydrolase family protein n=1 Tax=Cohnella rhizoplanae TaxID=2974897 RepID=UPI0022FF51B2|nr:alpha/beta hydrolase family protein [Cohnella sp. JJ-181]CAI6083105.1 hypothetical protein COHCIP112018_03869 [Cohnella sp. JJ-181]